jgi:hypothetical protein
MWAVIFVFGIVGFFNTDAIQSFRENSNHNPVYEPIRAVPCKTGLKSSGYSLAPSGRLFLKQVNRNGTVGQVCRN